MTAPSQPQTESSRPEILPPLPDEPKAGGWLGYALAVAGALVSAIYLANMGAGIFEIAPDVVPGIGNLDEVLFSFVLIYCMRKLGIDLLPHLRQTKE